MLRGIFCASIQLNPTPCRGAPACCSRNISLQVTSNPQLLGTNSFTAILRSRSKGTQAPSEPKRCQLAPPKAKTTASEETVLVVEFPFSNVEKINSLLFSKPNQR